MIERHLFLQHMKYATQYLKTAVKFIEDYDGRIPFSHYLKQQFTTEKKYGSRDRRSIAALCYYHFRLGHGEKVLPIEERIFLGIYLCEQVSNTLLEQLKPEWNKTIQLPLQEKLYSVDSFFASGIFPWVDELSDGMEGTTFALSFLIQPKLFIRVRPGKMIVVKHKLSYAAISFEQINDDCLSFENGTKLEETLTLNEEYVVQDYNSQRVGEFMRQVLSTVNMQLSTSVWDCCAASGGKSIMAYDLDPHIDLTVSDIRPSILQNLNKRFQEAGIFNYRPFVADLYYAKQLHQAINQQFHLVICDAPCTGSGTWSRTPEQLNFFDETEIERYSNLQKKIVSNVIPFVKPGGFLLYITCSVFKKENEEVLQYIQQNFDVQLQQMELLKGYAIKADTLFAALFLVKNKGSFNALAT